MRDYLPAVYALLPSGSIWPLEPGDAPVMDALLDALAQEYDRIDASTVDWLADYYPDASAQQLSDWERILGLTSDSSLSDSQRRGRIVSLLRRRSDPTLDNIQSIADAWERNAIVSQHDYPLFTMGLSVMGDELRSDLWSSTVHITYDGPASAEFETAMIASLPLHVSVVFEVV
jgi:uncharacterized protein YmfQ (DUF2313 family)